MYGAIIALPVAVVYMYGLQSFNLGESQTSSVNSESSFITGHVTMFVTAPDDKMITCRQSDNIIVNQGADCKQGTICINTRHYHNL